MNRKPFREKIGDFMAGRGFYIVLLLCVAAIGASGYYLFSNVNPGGMQVAGNPQIVVTPTPQPATAPPTAKPTQAPAATPNPTAPPAAPSPAPSAAPKPTPKPASVYTWPVKGELIRDYSLEVLAYDETMGDWRTHTGVDIAAEPGTQVLAVTDGTVLEIVQHDLMGTMVVIDHGNGMKSTYANLAVTPAVKAGDSVSTGTVIGAVGETAVAESGRPGHLHLEMEKDGTPVDPVNYLPARS